MNTHKPSQPAEDPKPNGNAKELREAKTEEPYPSRNYAPEDFSQLAINRGQRMINGELVEVDQKIAKAIEELKNVLANAPGLANTNFNTVQAAIDEVNKASKEVAGIIPPGCQYGPLPD